MIACKFGIVSKAEVLKACWQMVSVHGLAQEEYTKGCTKEASQGWH